LRGAEIPVFLAEKKSQAYNLESDTLLITADTIVWLDGEVFGKPADKAEATRMLKTLSGRTHQVISGVCIRTLQAAKTFSVISDVTFSALTDEEIDFYVEEYRPYDKAGAYGVQEWIGYVAVTHIEGSFYNIMGLPIQRLYTELKEF
jgi:septum formation protein